MTRKILKFHINSPEINKDFYFRVYNYINGRYLFAGENYPFLNCYYFYTDKEIEEAIRYFCDRTLNSKLMHIDLSSFIIETVDDNNVVISSEPFKFKKDTSIA